MDAKERTTSTKGQGDTEPRGGVEVLDDTGRPNWVPWRLCETNCTRRLFKGKIVTGFLKELHEFIAYYYIIIC